MQDGWEEEDEVCGCKAAKVNVKGQWEMGAECEGKCEGKREWADGCVRKTTIFRSLEVLLSRSSLYFQYYRWSFLFFNLSIYPPTLDTLPTYLSTYLPTDLPREIPSTQCDSRNTLSS